MKMKLFPKIHPNISLPREAVIRLNPCVIYLTFAAVRWPEPLAEDFSGIWD